MEAPKLYLILLDDNGLACLRKGKSDAEEGTNGVREEGSGVNFVSNKYKVYYMATLFEYLNN